MILSGHIFIFVYWLDVLWRQSRGIIGNLKSWASDFTSKFSLIRLAALRRIFLEAWSLWARRIWSHGRPHWPVSVLTNERAAFSALTNGGRPEDRGTRAACPRDELVLSRDRGQSHGGGQLSQQQKQSIVRLTINQGLSTRISKHWQWSQRGRLPCLPYKHYRDLFSQAIVNQWNINPKKRTLNFANH